MTPKRILLAKPGLDGHDVGVKVLAFALKDAGHSVIYTGLRKSVDEIVERAIREKPDVLGLSILSGSHAILCQRLTDRLGEVGLKIPWIVGGNIPLADVGILQDMGALRAFPTGTRIETVVDFINNMKP